MFAGSYGRPLACQYAKFYKAISYEDHLSAIVDLRSHRIRNAYHAISFTRSRHLQRLLNFLPLEDAGGKFPPEIQLQKAMLSL